MHRKRFDAESNLIDRNESRNSQRVQIEESNGLSKARVTSVTRNYVYQACIDMFALVSRHLRRGSSTTSSRPATAASNASDRRVVCGVVSQKHDSSCPK